jgi:hypothetical protein
MQDLLHGTSDQELGAHWLFAGLDIKPVTRRCVWNLLWDLPLSPAERTDFGVASVDHHRALQAVVRDGGDLGSEVEEDAAFRAGLRCLVVALDQACGHGPAITALVHQYAPEWQELTFQTPWDVFDGGLDEEEVPF